MCYLQPEVDLIQDAEIARRFLAALKSKLGDADTCFDERSAAGCRLFGQKSHSL